MYKVYVVRQRPGGSQVLMDTRTNTPSARAARDAWAELYDAVYSPEHLLLLTRDGEKLAVHRYGTQAGDDDFSPRELVLE